MNSSYFFIPWRITGLTLLLMLCGCTLSSPQSKPRYALVASEADAQVVVIDLDTEHVIQKIPTGKVPHAMATSSAGKIFVNNRGSKELTVIDGHGLKALDAIALPATSFQLATSPDEKTLAVVYRDALKLSLVDVASSQLLRTIDIVVATPAQFSGVMMKHPYWSPDGRFVYVADAVHQRIVKVDVAAGQVVTAIDINGYNHYLHASPDGQLLYAVNEQQGGGTSLTLIDAKTDRIVKHLPVALAAGEKPSGHHGAFTRDGRYFLFCNEGGQQISVLDTRAQAWVKTIATGKGPGHAALSPDGQQFFVIHHNDGVVSVIDANTLTLVRHIQIGQGDKQSHAAWFTPDGKFFYVVASGDNQLVKIDVAQRAVVSRMPVGGRSMFFAVKDGMVFPATEY